MSAAATPADHAHMARALQLAARGLYTTDPNPRVGCVLVRGERIVGEGWHRRAGEAHAERLALQAAGEAARGAIAYVSLEPCSHTGRTPPCADALIAAGVARVTCAAVDPNPLVAGAGIRRLRDAGIEVSVGLLEREARALNVGFFSRFERGRAHVRLKLAISLDGRTAHSGGVRAWVSGEAARADVQRLRARSSAVLTGAGTVRADDPQLTVRLGGEAEIRQPLRVVLDSDLSCAPASRVFHGGPSLIFAARDASADSPVGVPVERVARAAGGLDLRAVLAALNAHQVNELLVECGPRLAGAFLDGGLVDELILYVAPSLLGADAAPLAALAGLGAGRAVPHFEFRDVRRVGADMRLTLTPKAA